MLSEMDLRVLDIIANFRPLQRRQISEFWLSRTKPLSMDDADNSIKNLESYGFILVLKDEYDREIIEVNPEKRSDVLNVLRSYWEEKKITRDKLLEIAEKNDAALIRFLELKTSYENKTHLTFSDYYHDFQTHDFCQQLSDVNMVFKATWSSRKHDYEEYYLRKMPINVEDELHKYILSRVDVSSFRLDSEWRVLLLPMLIDSPIKMEEIEVNFPNLTRNEIVELLKKLQNKKALTISVDEVSIPKAIKNILKTDFLLHKYPDFESWMIQHIKKRIGESTSNLYLLGIIKKMLLSSEVSFDGPFAILKRSSITNIDSDDLKETAKLGLTFMTKDGVIIAWKVLEELESLLKSKIFEKVMRISANDTYTAIMMWKKIFGDECTEYIKIQDEYVNEETLRIIQSYSPREIKITILTSIEGSRDLDVEEMKQVVSDIKNSGRKLDLYFIGDSSGRAPFHFRYIISKDVCYAVTTAIKQVGKSKDADIIPIAKEEKEGLIEPAFDYWVSLPANKLRERGITRMEFSDWILHKFSV